MSLQLNLEQGIQAKSAGVAAMLANDGDFVRAVRAMAVELAQTKGEITIVDVRIRVEALGLAPKNPNAWGAIFRGPGWICVGRIKNALPAAHAREIKVWRYERTA